MSKSLFSTVCLICLSVSANSQVFLQTHKVHIKTNVLIDKKIQQWMLTLETKTKKVNQSNSFTIGYDRFVGEGLDLRERKYISYHRVFYSSPVFDNFYLSISPYGKILYRNVYQKGSGGGFVIFSLPYRNFKSTSIVLGGDIRIQAMVFKRISVSYLMGAGLGKILDSETIKDGTPDSFHIDGQIALQIGYVF